MPTRKELPLIHNIPYFLKNGLQQTTATPFPAITLTSKLIAAESKDTVVGEILSKQQNTKKSFCVCGHIDSFQSIKVDLPIYLPIFSIMAARGATQYS